MPSQSLVYYSGTEPVWRRGRGHASNGAGVWLVPSGYLFPLDSQFLIQVIGGGVDSWARKPERLHLCLTPGGCAVLFP